MKHAFLILAHDSPAALTRLVNRLRHKRVRQFIHLDRKSANQFDWLPLLESGATVISTRKVNWGGFSTCLAELDLLHSARAAGSFDTFSLISGRDYPVKRIDEIVRDLDKTDANLIECWHDKIPNWHRRYERMFFYDNKGARLLNALSRRSAPYLPRRRVPSKIVVHFGWAWWTLREDGVDAVFEFCDDRPDAVEWFKNVHIPDESFFQTALANSRIRPRLHDDVRRYIQFPGGSAHPKPIDFNDIDEMSSGRYWFARKFYEKHCPGILQEVDKKVHLLGPREYESCSI